MNWNKLALIVAASGMIAGSAMAQTYTTTTTVSPANPAMSTETNHPVADGVSGVAHSAARAVGAVATGVATGIDDLAHSTAQSVNPNPAPTTTYTTPPTRY